MTPERSARGHLTGTPTRGLHARGAGAPGDDILVPQVGVALRASRSPTPAARPGARRPRSVVATADARVAMPKGGRRPRPRTSAGGYFTGTPTRSLHAVAPDDTSGYLGSVA